MSFEVKASAWPVLAAFLAYGRLTSGSWWEGAAFALLLTASLLAHEGAHAAVALGYGVPVTKIGMSAAGAYTQRAHSPERRVELQAAIAGPLANLLLWGAFLAAPGVVPRMLATCNLILGMTNLVPIRPSDGWRIWKLLVTGTTAS